MPTTADRLLSLEQRIEHNTALIAEIHTAVVGDGSRQSSLRERVSVLEVSNDFRHRAVYSILPSIVMALLAQLGLHLHPGSPS